MIMMKKKQKQLLAMSLWCRTFSRAVLLVTLLFLLESCGGAMGLSMLNTDGGTVDALEHSEASACSVGAFLPLSGGDASTSFAYAAMVHLAITHFNQRDVSVVPQLATLQDCPVSIPLHDSVDTVSSTSTKPDLPLLIDTNGFEPAAVTFVQSELRRQRQIASNIACPIDNNSSDAGQSSSGGTQSTLDDYMYEAGSYCALVGPLTNQEGLEELSHLSQSLRIPLILAGGYSSSAFRSRYTLMATSGVIGYAQAVAQNLLQAHDRTNFVSILYPLSDFSNNLVESLLITLEEIGMERHEKYGYADPLMLDPSTGLLAGMADVESRSVETALRRVRRRGYRTIVWILDNVILDLPRIAAAARQVGLLPNSKNNNNPNNNGDNGEFFWMLMGNTRGLERLHESTETMFEQYLVARRSSQEEESTVADSTNNINSTTTANAGMVQQLFEEFSRDMRDLLQGSAVVELAGGNEIYPKTDPLLKTWRELNATTVDDIRPLRPERFSTIPSDFFQTHDPPPGAAFLYDAIMTAGFGACAAAQSNVTIDSASIRSDLIVDGIYEAVFEGASGRVDYLAENSVFPGTRTIDGTLCVGYNVRVLPRNGTTTGNSNGNGDDSSDDEEEVVLLFNESLYKLVKTHRSDNRLPSDDDYFGLLEQIGPFIYSSGSTEPPELLRNPPNLNLISPGVKLLGYILLLVGWGQLALFCIWIVLYRSHKVVKAAQPVFLLMVHVGSAAILSNIVAFSLEDDKWSDRQLSAACMTTPWLFILGFVVMFLALFSKLYRINELLQFRRKAINLDQALWPFRGVLAVTVIALIVWSVVEGSSYERTILNTDTGDSIGTCVGPNYLPWLLSGTLVVFGVIIMTIYIAWKTKDVDPAYSESTWVMFGIFTQFNCFLVAIPTLVLLTGQSSDARHIGYSSTCFVLSMPMSTLIMVPKFQAVYFPSHGGRLRGSTVGGSVQVTGLNSSLNSRAGRQWSASKASNAADEAPTGSEENVGAVNP